MSCTRSTQTRPWGALTDARFWSQLQPEELRLPADGCQPAWYGAVAERLPAGPGASCLEVGGYPGNTLLFFAKRRGYACTTIDLSPKASRMAAVFARHGVRLAVVHGDFCSWKPERQYDFVYSCGFVEHFVDFQSVIERHWRCVKPQGVMVLSTPALTPYQRLVRRIVYTTQKWEEVTSTHVQAIMSETALRKALASLPDLVLEASGYTRQMEVWVEPRAPGVRRWTRPVFRLTRLIERLGRAWGRSSRWYSTEVFVAARKIIHSDSVSHP